MKLKPWQKFGIAAVIGTALIILIVWAFLSARRELAQEQEQERPIKAQTRVSAKEGEVIITIAKETQIMGGLTVASLEPATHREKLKAYGIILNLQNLIDLQSKYIAAERQVQETQALSEVSRKEFDRLKVLHKDDRNISDKTLQAAEGKWRADRANAKAAKETLKTQKGVIQQRWGKVISKWISDPSPMMERLARRQKLLIEITLPLGINIPTAPSTIQVQAADGTLISSRLVSPAPNTDPRIQGLSFYYLVSASPGLLYKMNIIAYLPVGSQVQGVVIPSPAVVWWQGKAWVYLQRDDTRFIRQEISTDAPVEGGWFEKTRPSPGEKIVTQGAQLLLSEEFRAQIQVGE